MKEIKNNEPQERRAYVPASVKVINVTAQKVICTSFDQFQNGGEF